MAERLSNSKGIAHPLRPLAQVNAGLVAGDPDSKPTALQEQIGAGPVCLQTTRTQGELPIA